ncbi:MAG: VTT domain-containing protein [Actinomycetota bacterium]|nr:VTT domain-containing protein [Actinomycetota bacterium]
MERSTPARILRRARLGPRTRLGLLLAAIAAALVAFYALDLLSTDEVRAWIAPLGAGAAPAYAAVATGLGLLLVPGPLLAGVSGLLFGPVLGTAVTMTAAITSAVISLLIGRAVGRPGMAEISGPRMEALATSLERHGILAVVGQRLAPGIPDAPCSYLAGLLRIRPHQIALGTLIGSAPRAFSYTALGGSLDDLTSPIALVAFTTICLSGLVGAEIGRRALRRSRAGA